MDHISPKEWRVLSLKWVVTGLFSRSICGDCSPCVGLLHRNKYHPRLTTHSWVLASRIVAHLYPIRLVNFWCPEFSHRWDSTTYQAIWYWAFPFCGWPRISLRTTLEWRSLPFWENMSFPSHCLGDLDDLDITSGFSVHLS